MKTIRLSATATVLAYNSQALREMIGHRDSIDIFVELHLSSDLKMLVSIFFLGQQFQRERPGLVGQYWRGSAAGASPV